jgi:hypothetical protein
LEEKVHPFVIKGENRGAATKAEEPGEEGKKGAKKIVATPSPDPQHPGNGGTGYVLEKDSGRKMTLILRN